MQSEDTLSEVSAFPLWWTGLKARLESVKWALPEALSGTIQFEVWGLEEVRRFHLVADGPRTEAKEGQAEQFDSLVRAEDSSLAEILIAPSPGALRVWGDFSLVSTFFKGLSDPPPPKSWLQARKEEQR